MRLSCIDCVIKHISQAMILANEAIMGYPLHKYWAIGHLAEASDEAIKDFPELAHIIRAERLNYSNNDDYIINFEELLNIILESTKRVSHDENVDSRKTFSIDKTVNCIID